MPTGFSEDLPGLLKVGTGFDLAMVDTSSHPGFADDKAEGETLLAARAGELAELQERLWAESRFGGTRSVLLVLQAMDTAGKGGIVDHVAGAISPQGLRVHAFKRPTAEELEHDFLWRVRRQLPGPGIVGVFDRSHYEDVLIARVRSLVPPQEFESRYHRIVAFEQDLVANDTTIVKVMLHISKDEQRERLADRLETPEKQWKYNPGDVDERKLWDQYQEAYAIALARTSTDDAPWFVVPADRKWYARIAVQELLLGALRSLEPAWPELDYDVEAEKKRLAAD